MGWTSDFWGELEKFSGRALSSLLSCLVPLCNTRRFSFISSSPGLILPITQDDGGAAVRALEEATVEIAVSELTAWLVRWKDIPGLSDRQKMNLGLAFRCAQAALPDSPHQSPFALTRDMKEALAELFDADKKTVNLLGVVDSLEEMLTLTADPELKNKVDNALFWLRQIL